MMLTKRFEEALAFAAAAHNQQRRKGTGIPYVSHLLGVASIALELGADEDQAIAALLHDAVEDQGGLTMLAEIRARFGERVADIVYDCTDAEEEPKPPWRERKVAYIHSLATKPSTSLLVSLADKTHNARAIVDDLTVVGAELWVRFTGGREGTLWYYTELAQAFESHLPGHGADRLTLIVSRMHELA